MISADRDPLSFHFESLNQGVALPSPGVNLRCRSTHDTGDVVLRHFADTCRGRIRGQDMLGRMGGEEFLLVLPGAGTGEPWASSIGSGKASPPAGGGHDLPYTFSAGVAEAMRHEDRGSIVRRADRALYAAKREGRDRTKIDVAAFGTG
jgi:diguanylate cyclase